MTCPASEAEKLAEIREAFAIEASHLEELHDIQLAADTLALLIKEHAEKKAAFEAERESAESEFSFQLAEKRADWKKEQEAYAAALKENEARLKKERERERDEYNLALARKKEKDACEAAKAAQMKALEEERVIQEQELGAREAAVRAQEAEMADLRAKVSGFPVELSASVERAEKEAAASWR